MTRLATPVKAMNKNDVLAYLYVLGSGKLTPDQIKTARLNTLGCLIRIHDQLDADPSLADIAAAVAHRERLNGQRPYGHPELVAANEKCIDLLFPLLDADVDARKAVMELEMEAAATPSTPLSQECEAMFDWLKKDS